MQKAQCIHHKLALSFLLVLLLSFQINSLQHKYKLRLSKPGPAIRNDDEYSSDYNSDSSPVAPLDTSSQQANNLKVGGYIVINQKAGKIYDIKQDDQGKIIVSAKDIFTDQNLEDKFDKYQTVYIPKVERTSTQAISVDQDGYVVMMDSQGHTRQDLRIPNDTEHDNQVTQCIQNGLDQSMTVNVTIMKALQKEKIDDCQTS